MITLSLVDWGVDGWRLPLWFAAIVVLRDCIIIGGIRILWNHHRQVKIAPHWTGKVCTVTQMFALGWVMLKVVPVPPTWPCIIAGVFHGLVHRRLHPGRHPDPQRPPGKLKPAFREPWGNQVGCSPRAITTLPVRTVSMMLNCENMVIAASIFGLSPLIMTIIEVGVRSTVLPVKCSVI